MRIQSGEAAAAFRHRSAGVVEREDSPRRALAAGARAGGSQDHGQENGRESDHGSTCARPFEQRE
ncbi:MAG: hypothetical protein HY721_23765 [Planctomycetes bacterium]|nr:hypothetical protein [Planctomycetota bacterium]